MDEFYRLSSRCDLSLIKKQQTSKYINGLKFSIREHVAFQDVFSVDEAQNKAMKIERLQRRALPFKGAAERASSNTRSSTSSERPPAFKAIDTHPANPLMTAAATIKSKENPYANPGLASVIGVANLDKSLMSA